MFISGTGRTCAADAAEVAYTGTPRALAAARSTASEVPRMALAPSVALVGRAVELEQRAVDGGLVEHRATAQRGRDALVDVANGGQHALAAETGWLAVAQLERLVGAGRGARGNLGAAERAVVEAHVDFDGRVPARIEDLAGPDVDDEDTGNLSLSEVVRASPASFGLRGGRRRRARRRRRDDSTGAAHGEQQPVDAWTTTCSPTPRRPSGATACHSSPCTKTMPLLPRLELAADDARSAPSMPSRPVTTRRRRARMMAATSTRKKPEQDDGDGGDGDDRDLQERRVGSVDQQQRADDKGDARRPRRGCRAR